MRVCDQETLLSCLSAAAVFGAVSLPAQTVSAAHADQTCAGAVLAKDIHRYAVYSDRMETYGTWNEGVCLERLVHEDAVKGYFTKTEEPRQYAGIPKPFVYNVWKPAAADAEGSQLNGFYYVYSGRDRAYLDADDIPAGLPTCDARVKGDGARMYDAHIRTYGEPSRDLKSWVNTWNEIEGFRATNYYFRKGDCILLTGNAAKHEGKTIYQVTDPSGKGGTNGHPWVMADEIELIA
ncbi:hypothetical protein ACGFX2_38450 [Streptomyces goshikiensis]|uniref:hypothetical protein n=1 Tax=Streptomyces goshikiensis TaxID=1942 RepID=UPI003717F9DD